MRKKEKKKEIKQKINDEMEFIKFLDIPEEKKLMMKK